MPVVLRFVVGAFLGLMGLTLMPAETNAQSATRNRALGLALQAYPAGIIVAGRASFPIRSRSTLTVYGGYNLTDRQDFGEHDNEEGGGPGFGVAWHRYLRARYQGLRFGLRTDLWFLEIDWDDDAGPRSGTTDITVLQPTGQVGYSRTVSQGRLLLEATVSLGLEINIDTQGEPVGEGAILLGGISIAYRL